MIICAATFRNPTPSYINITLVARFSQPSPIDFNGMVCKHLQRTGPHLAELGVTLLDKRERRHKSHSLVLRLRELLGPYSVEGVVIKVVEVPPGPPVLSTLVAEIYGEPLIPYSAQKQAARVLMSRLSREAHVVEIDSTIESNKPRMRFVVYKPKAALPGISTEDIAETLTLANDGSVVGFVQLERESHPLPIELRLDPSE